MAITVTKPVDIVTGLLATLSVGGNLEANTTYYYIVMGWTNGQSSLYGNYTTAGSSGRSPVHSDISAEGNFTTTETDKTVTINWDNQGSNIYYNILLTTESGDYKNSGFYGGVILESIGTFTDGSVGIEIDAISTDDHVHHSKQLSNPMSVNISNDKGLIWVEFDSVNNYSLDDVYDAIISAGYSDYVHYDGYNFTLKGYLYSNSADAGTFWVESKRITMLKGCIKNMSIAGGFVFRFGRYGNDYYGGNPYYGCDIDLQGSRYTFVSQNEGGILLYDSHVSFARSRITTLPEPLYELYYNTGAGSYFSYKVADFNSSVLAGLGRGVTSDIKDTKWGQGNNWGNRKHIRLDIWSTNCNMPYYAGGTFYACNWNTFSQTFNVYTFIGRLLNYTDMYNCKFPGYLDGMIDNPYVKFKVNLNDPPTSFNYIMNNYSLNMTILDEAGNPLEGVNINAVDASGNAATWIEQDDSTDRLVTGNEYTTDRTTDANGGIFYYLKAYKNYLNPDNTEDIGGYSYDTFKENYYPYTITFSKPGYRDYTIIIKTLKEPITGVVTLRPPIYADPAPEVELVSEPTTIAISEIATE